MRGDLDAEQQFAGARLGRVAVELGDFRFQFGRVQVVGLGRLRVGVDRVALPHRAPQELVPHQHDVEHADVLETELVLAQLPQPLASVERDVASRRLEIAAEDFHERRLAAAVGADQAVAIAVAELDRDVLEQRLGAELHRDVGRSEQ